MIDLPEALPNAMAAEAVGAFTRSNLKLSDLEPSLTTSMCTRDWADGGAKRAPLPGRPAPGAKNGLAGDCAPGTPTNGVAGAVAKGEPNPALGAPSAGGGFRNGLAGELGPRAPKPALG